MMTTTVLDELDDNQHHPLIQTQKSPNTIT